MTGYRPLTERIGSAMRTGLASIGLVAVGIAAAKAPWGDYLPAASKTIPAAIVAQRPAHAQSAALCAQVQTEQAEPDQARADLMDRTWRAILEVESRDGRDPRCWTELPTGELGPAQMMRCRVDDVNRILGSRQYTYEDRLKRRKCREMFEVSCDHYWPQGGPEQWARHWNGSPTRGPSQQATEGYWQRIQQAMDQAE